MEIHCRNKHLILTREPYSGSPLKFSPKSAFLIKSENNLGYKFFFITFSNFLFSIPNGFSH